MTAQPHCTGRWDGEPGAAGERFLIPVLSFMESLLFLDHTLPVAAQSSTVEE